MRGSSFEACGDIATTYLTDRGRATSSPQVRFTAGTSGGKEPGRCDRDLATEARQRRRPHSPGAAA